MKKITLIILLVLFSCFIQIKSASANNKVEYDDDLSDGMPSEWDKYIYSDRTNLTVSSNNSNLKLHHTNYNNDVAKLYYGGLVKLGDQVNNLGNFTFEITFKFNTYADSGRWIGILYHTQYDSTNRLSSYSMVLRANGSTHQSTITTSSSFNDHNVTPSGINLTDKNFHTIKITSTNDIVRHYVDNILTLEYDSTSSTYTAGLNSAQKTGGFALIVNKSEIEISSLKISGEYKKPVLSADTTLADCYDPNDALVSDIGVIANVCSSDDLEEFSDSEATPSTAILTIDKNINVLDKDGKSIGLSFKEVYNSYLKGKIIPALYIKNKEIADAFIHYSQTELNLLDMAVISSDPNIIKHIREQNTIIRGIIDFSDQELLTKESWINAVAKTNSSYANTIIMSSKDATYEAIRYIQARFKTVWVNNKSVNDIDIVEQITNGAYGIISNDYKKVFEALNFFNYESTYKKYTRASYNIAHRGLCLTNYENSLEGYIEAYENGATHIETDVHLTKDGKIVVMHDNTLDRTTNGTGNIANMTYNEISKYKIIKTYSGYKLGNGVKIPLLSDLFDEFKNKDLVLVVEIKTSDTKFVETFKALLNEYKIQDQVVVISFNTNQLATMKDILPEIPTANLNQFTNSTLASTGLATCGALNCSIDTSAGNTNKTFTRNLALRGYSSWYWTYQNDTDIIKAIDNGCLGITNNSADSIPDFGIRIFTEKDYVVVSDFNDTIELNVETYLNTETKTIEATPIIIEEHGNYAYAIYKATYKSNMKKYQLHSQKIKIVLRNSYISVNKMLEVLSKQAKDLTDEDILLLNKMPAAYELLTDEEKEMVDISKATTLLDEYNNLDYGGCQGSIQPTLSCLIILSSLIYVRNYKKSKKDEE